MKLISLYLCRDESDNEFGGTATYLPEDGHPFSFRFFMTLNLVDDTDFKLIEFINRMAERHYAELVEKAKI